MMSSEMNGGMVKKLLFPVYDAGRNDTYLPTSTNNNHHHQRNNKPPSVVSSEASTAIRDNRTIASPPKVSRSISATAVVFPFDDEAAGRNPEGDDLTPREDDDGSNTMNIDTTFEEEATPEQTAFGKQLLFQRNIVDPKTLQEDDDALSTASESGTIIEQQQHGINPRMMDLDRMLLEQQQDNTDDDPKRVLAMPTLDDHSPRPTGTSTLQQLLRSPKRDTTSGPNTILSSTMRRMATAVRSPESPKRTFARRRINTKVLPMRSCFSFDTAKDTAVPSNKASASWDAGGQIPRRTFSTPTRIGPTHRLEIEREDAIDILSCLVERGISWKPSCNVPTAVAETPKAAERTVVELVKSLDVSEDRKACLVELVKSHEYALEMKRASKSASVWLQSIGRQSPSKTKVLFDDTTTITTTDVAATSTDLTETASPMDLVTTKALLHAAQRELKERSQQYERLNDELAQCRAEIGRLNTLNSQFRSNVNRSILDENDEEEEEEPLQGDRVLDDDDDGAVNLDTSFLRESTQVVPKIEEYRKALQEANEIIAKLHSEKGIDEPAPIVSIPNIIEEEDEEKSLDNNSPSNKEERMINVRMLDAENFETEWDDLVPPLPSVPPEHDLRSPIVSAVLQSWTKDHGLHESLLQWIEQILDTDDEVPPLTLSGLDHQVRDGFCLHILPLLLRKPDIHVNVQTRLQRRTTYDLAVSVEPTRPHHVLDSSVASTAVISNREPSARLSYDELVEPGIKSPDDDEPVTPGAWTSISGAIWGSLTSTSNRRKPNADVEEPYHRVVSAPAGRIGVTFVEYRGHCMVSDVAVDSPLLNWVYPSDVLIAIDELPVSGMRVRDIIKVLKDRSERQRALRVVSSHSMSTLTASH